MEMGLAITMSSSFHEKRSDCKMLGVTVRLPGFFGLHFLRSCGFLFMHLILAQSEKGRKVN